MSTPRAFRLVSKASAALARSPLRSLVVTKTQGPQGDAQAGIQMSRMCVPGGQVPLRTLLLTSKYLSEQRKRGFGAWRTLRLCRSKRRHIASDRQLTSIERQVGAPADPTPSARSVFGDKSLPSEGLIRPVRSGPRTQSDPRRIGPDLNLPGRARSQAAPF